MITEEKIEEMIKENMLFQFTICKGSYYKSMLRMLIGSMSTIILILSGIVAWSYGPLGDIRVLKREVEIMHCKLDLILKIENESIKSGKPVNSCVNVNSSVKK